MDILEQLVFDGTAKKDFKKFEGKLKFTLRTLTGGEQMDIESFMADVKGTPSFIVHTYSMQMLARCLVTYQDNNISEQSIENKVDYIKNFSTTILDMLIDTHADFQKECELLIKPEKLENLSQTPS